MCIDVSLFSRFEASDSRWLYRVSPSFLIVHFRNAMRGGWSMSVGRSDEIWKGGHSDFLLEGGMLGVVHSADIKLMIMRRWLYHVCLSTSTAEGFPVHMKQGAGGRTGNIDTDKIVRGCSSPAAAGPHHRESVVGRRAAVGGAETGLDRVGSRRGWRACITA